MIYVVYVNTKTVGEYVYAFFNKIEAEDCYKRWGGSKTAKIIEIQK